MFTYAGMLTLSPMMVAPVCRVGDPLTITYTAFVQFIGWRIMVFNERGTLEEIIAFSNSRDTSQQVSFLTVNSTTFTFMRSSARGASPLTSTLSIDSVSIGLNGTVVHCREEEGSMPASESTTIQVFDANSSELAIVQSLILLYH